MASIIDQIPGMSDDQLAALRHNATRISEGEDGKQRTAALEVLTVVDEQIATRTAAKRAEMAERRAQAKPSTKTKRASKAKTA